MIFKLQPPENLISRLYILEYMREIGANTLYEKSAEAQRRAFFYRFTSEDGNIEEIDINWEYCLFEATIPQLEYLMGTFIDEVEEIERTRQEIFSKLKAEATASRENEPASISVYDLAKSSMDQSKSGELTDVSGFKLS